MMPEVPDLYAMVYDMVSDVPEGMVTTYGDIARALGDVRAARAVGEILSQNPRPIVVPCHRVVYSDGRVGWYNGRGNGEDVKTDLLSGEGVPMHEGRVDLVRSGFDDFGVEPVLVALREAQLVVADAVDETDADYDAIAGMDVSYEGRTAYGAVVICSPDGELQDVHTVSMEVRFPYIPTYLGYREIPVLMRLLQDDGVLHMVDGNGRLHPYRAGLACQLGVWGGVRSMGVAKSLLCGRVVDGDVVVDGEVLGREVSKGRRPVYASVGNGISLPSAEAACRDAMRHRLPEPTRLAHTWANRVRCESSPKD